MESLALEVLIARARLGESLWTFDFDITATKTLRSLEDKGLVQVQAGTVERTVRASLTDEGRKLFMSKDYSSPILEEHAAKIARYLDDLGYDANAGKMIRKKFGRN
jgi:DNA-binding MarR family transcriptional regulator